MNQCYKILSFGELKEYLDKYSIQAVKYDRYLTEREILKAAKTLNKEIVWRPFRDWIKIERREDYNALELLHTCCEGLTIEGEVFAVITMESYNADKTFLLEYECFMNFVENYDSIIEEDIDFIAPMDYIFILLKQRVVVLLHHEGIFAQIFFH